MRGDVMKPLIKWPGGKSSEIKYIEKMLPKFDRYVEPFFGGGALYFDLMPEKAVINDISDNLIYFYRLIKENDLTFKRYLIEYNELWENLKSNASVCVEEIVPEYLNYRNNKVDDLYMEKLLSNHVAILLDDKGWLKQDIVLDYKSLHNEMNRMVLDKVKRTKSNEKKNDQLLCDADLRDNILTGFTSGLYMHFRNIYNNIQLENSQGISLQYKIANFYFIREFCYGSMFRYNSKGEFNIPYGGISYNKKDFNRKIKFIFNKETINLFRNTDIFNLDFEDFIQKIDPSPNDFVFLDPPYDSDFSDYEGMAFTEEDQIRLSKTLINMKAKFILIIKNTEFIYNLYNNTNLNILSFSKNYTYNVRSRNERNTKHLIITNIKGSV